METQIKTVEQSEPETLNEIEAQYTAVRAAFGIIDRTDTGKLAIKGADRFSWLQAMVSNDVRLLEKGNTNRLQSCILDATGHVLSTMTLINIHSNVNASLNPGINDANSFVLMELPVGNTAKIAALLDRYLIMEDVEIEDVSSQWGCLSIQGIQTKIQTGSSSENNNPLHSLRVFRSKFMKSGDVSLDASSVVADADHTGSGGWDLYLREAEYARIKASWQRQGHPFIGESAQEILRIEAGIVKYGVDMDETTLAPEAGLMSTHVSLTKGCYVGQEIVARIDSRGHTNRALTGLVFAEGDVPGFGDKIHALEIIETGAGAGATDLDPVAKITVAKSNTDQNMRETGRITSVVASSPVMNGRPISLGYVRHEHREPGRRLQVRSGTRTLEAEVVALPFYTRPVAPRSELNTSSSSL